MVADDTRPNRCRCLDPLVERGPYVLVIRRTGGFKCNGLVTTVDSWLARGPGSHATRRGLPEA
jgi:hypothetical protein